MSDYKVITSEELEEQNAELLITNKQLMEKILILGEMMDTFVEQLGEAQDRNAWLKEFVSGDCEKEVAFWRLAHRQDLTHRQTELLLLLRTSMSIDEIALNMSIERGSVFWLQNGLFKKLGVKSRGEAVAMFGGKVTG